MATPRTRGCTRGCTPVGRNLVGRMHAGRSQGTSPGSRTIGGQRDGCFRTSDSPTTGNRLRWDYLYTVRGDCYTVQGYWYTVQGDLGGYVPGEGVHEGAQGGRRGSCHQGI